MCSWVTNELSVRLRFREELTAIIVGGRTSNRGGALSASSGATEAIAGPTIMIDHRINEGISNTNVATGGVEFVKLCAINGVHRSVRRF